MFWFPAFCWLIDFFILLNGRQFHNLWVKKWQTTNFGVSLNFMITGVPLPLGMSQMDELWSCLLLIWALRLLLLSKSCRTHHSWIVHLRVDGSCELEMFCQDTIICCTIGDTDNKINYSTVICTNNILTTVITLMIISGASMIKVYTNVANVEKHFIMRWHSVNIGNFTYKYKQSV